MHEDFFSTCSDATASSAAIYDINRMMVRMFLQAIFLPLLVLFLSVGLVVAFFKRLTEKKKSFSAAWQRRELIQYSRHHLIDHFGGFLGTGMFSHPTGAVTPPNQVAGLGTDEIYQ